MVHFIIVFRKSETLHINFINHVSSKIEVGVSVHESYFHHFNT